MGRRYDRYDLGATHAGSPRSSSACVSDRAEKPWAAGDGGGGPGQGGLGTDYLDHGGSKPKHETGPLNHEFG